MSDHAEKLRSTIAEMIRKLENEEYRLFLEEHAEPIAIIDAKTDGQLDRLAERAKNRSDQLFRVLEAAQQSEPEFNQEESQAVFSGTEFPRPLTFKRIDEKWYMMNR